MCEHDSSASAAPAQSPPAQSAPEWLPRLSASCVTCELNGPHPILQLRWYGHPEVETIAVGSIPLPCEPSVVKKLGARLVRTLIAHYGPSDYATMRRISPALVTAITAARRASSFLTVITAFATHIHPRRFPEIASVLLREYQAHYCEWMKVTAFAPHGVRGAWVLLVRAMHMHATLTRNGDGASRVARNMDVVKTHLRQFLQKPCSAAAQGAS